MLTTEDSTYASLKYMLSTEGSTCASMRYILSTEDNTGCRYRREIQDPGSYTAL